MWKNQNNTLEKIFAFKTFKQAIEFVNKVADISDSENHHPEIKINYNKVTLSLTTHDKGNKVTALDHKLAKQFDELI